MELKELKSELQGNKGLIRLIRDSHLPDTRQMALAAQNLYERENNDFSNIDSALEELLKVEYLIFFETTKGNHRYFYRIFGFRS